jgi:hypothetical protein
MLAPFDPLGLLFGVVGSEKALFAWRKAHDFTHPRIFDSDTILRLEDTPHSMTIYGAGVIGCEYKPAGKTRAGLGWAKKWGIRGDN